MLSPDVVTDADAYRVLEEWRWGDQVRCTKCGGTNVYLVEPENGVSRRVAGGCMSERRVWRCRACRRQFSVLVGTVMHSSGLPVRKWLTILTDEEVRQGRLSTTQFALRYGVTRRTAWHIVKRLRGAEGLVPEGRPS